MFFLLEVGEAKGQWVPQGASPQLHRSQGGGAAAKVGGTECVGMGWTSPDPAGLGLPRLRTALWALYGSPSTSQALSPAQR